jgi:hypothetical protein
LREGKQARREKNNKGRSRVEGQGKRNPRRRATEEMLWEYLWGKKSFGESRGEGEA